MKYGCDANDEWDSGGTIHHCLCAANVKKQTCEWQQQKATHHERAGERARAAESVLRITLPLPLTLPLWARARLPARIAPTAKVVPTEAILHVTHEPNSRVDALAHQQRVLLQPGGIAAVHDKALGCTTVSEDNATDTMPKGRQQQVTVTYIGHPMRREAEGAITCARQNAGWRCAQ